MDALLGSAKEIFGPSEKVLDLCAGKDLPEKTGKTPPKQPALRASGAFSVPNSSQKKFFPVWPLIFSGEGPNLREFF